MQTSQAVEIDTHTQFPISKNRLGLFRIAILRRKIAKYAMVSESRATLP